MAPSYESPVLPADALVFITGVNGYIASHIAEQALEAGLRVRGTVRNLERSKWIVDLFDKRYGKGKIELVVIEQMATPGAFDDVIKGASAVIHCASDVSLAKDPNTVIPVVIDGARNILKAAAKEPSVKRFVYTSSSAAVTSPEQNVEYQVSVDTWNDNAVTKAWKEPFDDEGHEWATYSASKTQGERATWEYVKENKPNFILNTVLPNMTFGSILHESQHKSSTPQMVVNTYHGDVSHTFLPAQYFVDVSDVARLHIAAVLSPEVENERLFAYAEPFNWTRLLQTLRKLYPSREFPSDIPNEGHDLGKIPNKRAEELLKPFGRSGWTSFEESIKANTALLA